MFLRWGRLRENGQFKGTFGKEKNTVLVLFVRFLFWQGGGGCVIRTAGFVSSARARRTWQGCSGRIARRWNRICWPTFSGTAAIDVDDWQASAVYDGFGARAPLGIVDPHGVMEPCPGSGSISLLNLVLWDFPMKVPRRRT